MSAPASQQTHQEGSPASRIPEFDFADRVAKIRKMMECNQKEFAGLLGTPSGTVAGWEAGVQPRNLIGVARKISAVSGVPVGWILGVFTDAAEQSGPNSENDSSLIYRLSEEDRRTWVDLVKRLDPTPPRRQRQSEISDNKTTGPGRGRDGGSAPRRGSSNLPRRGTS
jgi:transcriptional regulator with XRE-family HTH domain